MANKDELFIKAFEILEQDGKPTEQQKDMMLNNILTKCTDANISLAFKLKKIIITYPWRFAFTASAVQAVVLTIIFGTNYTNLFLNLFGG